MVKSYQIIKQFKNDLEEVKDSSMPQTKTYLGEQVRAWQHEKIGMMRFEGDTGKRITPFRDNMKEVLGVIIQFLDFVLDIFFDRDGNFEKPGFFKYFKIAIETIKVIGAIIAGLGRL